MAIVKAKYTRSIGRIKAHLRYITHRSGREGEKLARPVFTYDYQAVDKPYAYHRFDLAPKGTYFYKIILSHDPKREDTRKDLDLRYLTERAMNRLSALLGNEARTRIQFVAAIHNDHTAIRHIHSIALLNRRLTRREIYFLKQSVTQEALQQRKLLDRVRNHSRLQYLTQAWLPTYPASAQKRHRSYKPVRIQHGCYHCGYGQLTGIPRYRLYCPGCHRPLTDEKTMRVELGRQL
jgi:RNase P subunit RPR2